jgi:glutathione-regulated potassium-efflux system ancillary protein KefF
MGLCSVRGMSKAILVYAHPYPDRSRANRVLFDAVRTLPDLDARAIYDLYPDFDIDVEREQAALAEADLLVWQHPIYWYTVPALLKLWWEKVLAHGWAYGVGGDALVGKRCLWVATTGGEDVSYEDDAMHAHPFTTYEPVVRQTARFCGMGWETPLILHGAHRVSETELYTFAGRYRQTLVDLLAAPSLPAEVMSQAIPEDRLGPSMAPGGRE